MRVRLSPSPGNRFFSISPAQMETPIEARAAAAAARMQMEVERKETRRGSETHAQICVFT